MCVYRYYVLYIKFRFQTCSIDRAFFNVHSWHSVTSCCLSFTLFLSHGFFSIPMYETTLNNSPQHFAIRSALALEYVGKST